MKKIILRMENVVTESYGVRGLNHLSLIIGTGEVIGMITVNQHGITELVELLLQSTPIKEGEMFFEEKKIFPKERNKVSIIDRKIRLVEGMTIAENLFVIRENFNMFVIKKKALEEESQLILNQHYIPLKATVDAGSLNHLERCQIELVKAVLSGAKLVLLRDLGKVLSYSDLNKFNKLMREFAREGVAFLYISNYPDEAFYLCSRLVIYENGRIIKSFYSKQFDDKELSPYLPVVSKFKPIKAIERIPILTLNKFVSQNKSPYSTTIHQGECLTILDCNQTQLPHILDLFHQKALDIKPFGVKFEESKANILLIPENAIQRTLFHDCTYLFNLTFFLDKKLKRSIIPRKVIRSIKKEFESEISDKIKLKSLASLNKYELMDLIYYRALLQRPSIIIIYQPFIDVDMDLQPHIEGLINKLKRRMITVIVLTSYLANLEFVSDEVIRIEDGTLLEDSLNKRQSR